MDTIDVLDLFAEDLALPVDALPSEVALSSFSSVSSLDCLTCPVSTASSNGTVSSAG
ncbi:hypothetical protein P3T36_000735 [Kitasatospora sp. MAP12-15]|uniref:thiocillin family RiPP n=1 Tax=unclassified Kitasatospora TaxID=2633591 RepID=UPI000B17E4AD|nr:thiocillin family RiPP [Kitasatospora sp. MAP12-44]MDH6114334.1 hypothetical protein [Kitasatospora sp. MAP12-44]